MTAEQATMPSPCRARRAVSREFTNKQDAERTIERLPTASTLVLPVVTGGTEFQGSAGRMQNEGTTVTLRASVTCALKDEMGHAERKHE